MITGKKILVTGGAGSVGSELVRQLYKDNVCFVFDNNETALFDLIEELEVEGRLGDVRDIDTVREVFKLYEPNYVFHAAALKHVTPSMKVPREYVQTNLIGTLNVLDTAATHLVEKIINISSDKAVQSENVMGWSKKGTELFTRIYGGISVRFGNVLGSRGSVIPIWQKQIDEGRALTVTDAKAERFMMTIEEAVGLVIEAAERGQSGDIFILDLDKKRVNVLELAKEIIKGRDIPIEIIGLRPGEALSESLMTDHERTIARKEGGFFILGSG